jgi:hypothetical protein
MAAGRHAERVTERQRRRHVPADHAPGQHAQLAAEAADQVPDLPTLGGQRTVQPRRAVRAGFACRLRSSARPRRRTSRRERGGVFFLFQQQALRDVGQLEGLEDRPDVEQRVDGLGARDRWGCRRRRRCPPRRAPPAAPAPWRRRQRAPRRRPPRARPRRPDRCASPPSARWSAGAAAPARRGRGRASGRVGQVERQHQYTSMSLIRVAVHIRPTTLSRAACQSKVACTPCGPEISMRGRGR